MQLVIVGRKVIVVSRRKEQRKIYRYGNIHSFGNKQNCITVFCNFAGFCFPPLEQQPF
jgi:uncharacterized protein YlbG (UPF0298 family)